MLQKTFANKIVARNIFDKPLGNLTKISCTWIKTGLQYTLCLKITSSPINYLSGIRGQINTEHFQFIKRIYTIMKITMHITHFITQLLDLNRNLIFLCILALKWLVRLCKQINVNILKQINQLKVDWCTTICASNVKLCKNQIKNLTKLQQISMVDAYWTFTVYSRSW